MENVSDKKKTFDNLIVAAIVIVSILIGYFLGRNSNGGPQTVSSVAPRASNASGVSSTDPIGRSLSLPDVDWAKNKRTLVLALQTGCHFCSESGPFYQRLVQQRSRFGDTRLIAVLPQSIDESTKYLNKLGFAVDDVKQGSLGEIGVKGTPTLMLVNGEGIVTEAWHGKLQPDGEKEVLARLQIK